MFTTTCYLFFMHKENIKDAFNQLLSLPFENINSHREPISHFESSRRQNRTLLAAIASINISLTRLTAVPLAHTSPFRIPVQSTSSMTMAMPRYHSHLAEFLSFSDSHLSSQSRIEMFVFLHPRPTPSGDRACQQHKYVSAILASSTKWLKVGQQVSSKRNAITKCYYLALNRGCSAPG